MPGNRDFAEFLAYFRECREGDVFIQYYLLLTDPEQRFNFGLAGPEWFLSGERHGHAVWLQTDEGIFRHRPNEGWKQLFAPRAFAWYFIDIVYHIELAEDIYQRLQDWPDRGVRMLLKLADVRHLQGDVEAERSLRESIYGRMDFEQPRDD